MLQLISFSVSVVFDSIIFGGYHVSEISVENRQSRAWYVFNVLPIYTPLTPEVLSTPGTHSRL